MTCPFPQIVLLALIAACASVRAEPQPVAVQTRPDPFVTLQTLAAGRIARRWGTSWDGSLILGTAARPFPSVSVEAASGPLDHGRWWWWLGEVDFSAFFGELEEERGDDPRPYQMGMRLVLRPSATTTAATSRTAALSPATSSTATTCA